MKLKSQSKKNFKFLTNALGIMSWSSNNIGNRSLNYSLCFLEPMMINSVLLGFSFSFEFVIQVKTSVTQDFKSVRDSKLQNRIEIYKFVCRRHRDDVLHHA